MAEPMSVSMTVRLIDEASAQARGITSAIRDLTAAGDALNGTSAGAGRVGQWDAEGRAVRQVADEVRMLGGLRQNTGAIDLATSAYREEAAAVRSVAEAGQGSGERLVDMVRRQAAERRAAFNAAQAAETAATETAIGKLHEEAAAVEGVIAKMRELGTAARTSVPSIPLAQRGGEPAPGPYDWGNQAGKHRDWPAYWREQRGEPPEEPPTATAPPRVPEEPPTATHPPAANTSGGGGLIDMVVSGAELASGMRLLRGSYEQAADAAGQRAAMRAAGIPDDEGASLSAAASRVSRQSKVFDENETLEMARDARTVLGSTAHAIEALPDIVKLATLAEAQRPEQGREGIMALIKGMETSGATSSPEQFHALEQSLAKVTNVFGKTIDFAAWGQYFKYGGTAAQHMSPEFTEQKLPHLIQELGGSSTGTMLQTMERAIVEGRMDQGAIRTMRQYGLLDEGKVHEAHGKYSLDAGAVRGADTFMKDPSEWVQSVLRPALDAAHLTEGERANATGKMFSSRLTERGMSILENQDSIVQKDAAQIRQAHGLEAASDLARTDPHLVNRAAEAQTRNTERRAGDPVINPLLGIENWYSSALGRLNENLFDKVPGSATAAVATAVGAAGYMGWKTWEHGFANTAKDTIRLPGDAIQGLLRGVIDGARQAGAEAGTPTATATRAGTALDGAAPVASRLGAVSEQLGTFGMMLAWAMQQDKGAGTLGHPIAPADLARNPLGIHLPGDPDTPRASAPPEAMPLSPTASAMPSADALARAIEVSIDPLRSDIRATIEAAKASMVPPPPTASAMPPADQVGRAIQAAIDPLRYDIRASLEGAKANIAPPKPTAEAPQQVTNNQQRYITAPVTVSAPITINATLNNTTPAAIAGTVSGGVAAGVRAGAAALHDGTETK